MLWDFRAGAPLAENLNTYHDGHMRHSKNDLELVQVKLMQSCDMGLFTESFTK